MPLERVAGQEIWVARQGETGPERLMIHCALTRHETLLPLDTALEPSRTTLFDLPGHGRSAAWSGTDYVAEAVAIAEELCVPGAHVIGHSLGGVIALRLALERPDLVARLTLIEPVLFAAATGTTGHAQHLCDFAPFDSAMARGDRAAAAELFNTLWGLTPWRSLPEPIRRKLARQIALIPQTEAAVAEDDAGLLAPGRLEGLTCPVTLIRGGRSQPVIADIHATLLRRLPDATDHLISGAGHMVPITHPDEVALCLCQ